MEQLSSVDPQSSVNLYEQIVAELPFSDYQPEFVLLDRGGSVYFSPSDMVRATGLTAQYYRLLAMNGDVETVKPGRDSFILAAPASSLTANYYERLVAEWHLNSNTPDFILLDQDGQAYVSGKDSARIVPLAKHRYHELVASGRIKTVRPTGRNTFVLLGLLLDLKK